MTGHRRSPADLHRQLTAHPPVIAPLTLLAGDEALLLIEAADTLRSAAQTSGFHERTSLILDARSDWGDVLAATQNVSLFGDQTLIELKLPSGKPGRVGADTLIRLAELIRTQAIPHTRVVLSLPRLDRTTRNSKWCAALLQVGCLVEFPTIERAQLPDWIRQRLAQQQQSLDATTLAWMADRVEGNLLAAHQEILKLGLLYPQGQLSQEHVEAAVLDVARYDINGLRQAMLQGQTQRALQILTGLQAEGEALPLVSWAVSDELRALSRLAQAQAQGQDIASLFRQLRVFGPRESLVRQALGRAPGPLWSTALLHAHDIDRLIKGLPTPGRLADPWDELARLITRIALAVSPTRSARTAVPR